jgi:putative transcriptional regulator
MFPLQPDPEAGLTGRLLIAMPPLVSSPFAQSVIFLCAHSIEDGAMGLVINRRLSQPGFDELLEQLGVEPTPPRRRIALCAGGPVENSRGFVLHSADWTGDGSLAVDDAIVLTASLDVLKVIAEGAGPRHALLALGHATWAPGQLEEEMQQNAWLSAPSSDAIVFGPDHDSKWRRALASLNIDPIRLSSATGHA